MALETLKDLKHINGYEVLRLQPKENSSLRFIRIDDNKNEICFKIQDGPIKEVGINGCQIDTICETALIMLEGLNKKFPCVENKCAINRLCEAIMFLDQRKLNRIGRGVEGLSKA